MTVQTTTISHTPEHTLRRRRRLRLRSTPTPPFTPTLTQSAEVLTSHLRPIQSARIRTRTIPIDSSSYHRPVVPRRQWSKRRNAAGDERADQLVLGHHSSQSLLHPIPGPQSIYSKPNTGNPMSSLRRGGPSFLALDGGSIGQSPVAPPSKENAKKDKEI
jgi:hypothetical protein